jgi:hypothetical protein
MPIMRWKQGAPGLVAVGLMTGCTMASLSARGNRVLPLATAPGPECKNLGTVIGSGGGILGGAYLSNERMVQYALNDAMNKTAARGGTHFFPHPPAFGSGDGTTTTATLLAIAYKCPPGSHGAPEDMPVALETGSVTAAEEPPASFLDDCPGLEGESMRERALRCKKLFKERQEGTE